LNTKSPSENADGLRDATRILETHNKTLEQEFQDLHRLCEQQYPDCLADKATLLISSQKTAGLICPEIEQKIINGVAERYPYDLLIEGGLIRRYFSPGLDLNPKDIPTDHALKAWGILYHIEFQYNSDSDTYHFSKY